MMRRWQTICVLVLLGVIAWFARDVAATSIGLNQAQLERLRTEPQPETYAELREQAPDSRHLNWQLAEVYLRQGDLDSAAMLFNNTPPDMTNQTELIARVIVLSANGQANRALPLLKGLDTLPIDRLPAETTAQLVLAQADQGVLEERTIAMLLHLLGHDPLSPGALAFRDAQIDADFWQTPMGRQIYQTLLWRAASGLRSMHTPVSGNVSTVDEEAVRQQVQAQLKVPVTLGANLIQNGDFDLPLLPCLPTLREACYYTNWSQSHMTTGDPWNFALFAVGPDRVRPYAGNAALRIDGIYLEQHPEREAARSGLWHAPIEVAAGQPYVLSFVYRTAQVTERGAGLWLSAKPEVLFAGEQFLPPTNGLWKRVVIIAWNRSQQPEQIQPLLRLWGTGSVWYDNVSLYQIATEQLIPVQHVIVGI
jgi:hypothetical protein